jgi:IS30 family transposase
MRYRKRTYYTEEQKALMWDRWQEGDSIHDIARLFDRYHSSVRGIFSRCGGIRPPIRRRSARSLTLAEREEISRGIAVGQSLRCIALRLNRAPSTVSREVPKICKLARQRELARLVAGKLQLQWSPEEIAGWLRREYPHDENRQVSHETIYKTLFIQARGALKKELLAHLRRNRAMRRPRGHTQKNQHIKGVVSIRERPAEVEDRAVPGHWEGDLLLGTKGSQIATLVERQTRYCMLVRVKRRDTETVINALIKQAHKLPRELYKSLTWDRGTEITDHQRFTLDTGIKVYLCDPGRPWQRGTASTLWQDD